MRRTALIALVLLSIMAGGCPRASAPFRPASGGKLPERTEHFIANGLDFKLGHSRAMIIQNIGQPADIRIEAIEYQGSYKRRSPDDLPPDENIRLMYDGLLVELFHASLEDEEVIQHISVTDRKYNVKWNLDIGNTRSAVKTILGKPTEQDDFSYIYHSRQSDSYVQFFFKDDAIYRIDWWHNYD